MNTSFNDLVFEEKQIWGLHNDQLTEALVIGGDVSFSTEGK